MTSAPTYTLREATSGDHEAVANIVSAAFKREDETKLVRALWAADAMRVEMLAEKDGAPIGYCAFSPLTAKPALDGVMLGLAPVAVTPDHQSKGAGTAVVNAGLAACRKLDARLIAVLGEPSYYGRFGFKPAAASNMSWAGQDVGDAFQIMEWGADAIDRSSPIELFYHPTFDTVS